MLCIAVRIILFSVTGYDNLNIVLSKEGEYRKKSFFIFLPPALIKHNNTAESSPVIEAITAAIALSSFIVTNNNEMIRTACSVNCDRAGKIGFSLPMLYE